MSGKLYRLAAENKTRERFMGDVRVDIALSYPDKRRRDIDNILKPILDAIGHAGIYKDDSQVKELYVCHRTDIPYTDGGNVVVQISERASE